MERADRGGQNGEGLDFVPAMKQIGLTDGLRWDVRNEGQTQSCHVWPEQGQGLKEPKFHHGDEGSRRFEPRLALAVAVEPLGLLVSAGGWAPPRQDLPLLLTSPFW